MAPGSWYSPRCKERLDKNRSKRCSEFCCTGLCGTRVNIIRPNYIFLLADFDNQQILSILILMWSTSETINSAVHFSVVNITQKIFSVPRSYFDPISSLLLPLACAHPRSVTINCFKLGSLSLLLYFRSIINAFCADIYSSV